ncbi:hypothetical protein B0H10DRAFT_2071285 [Mycena sp. CBHHK59/15]|nr:hypothetical protein B0H10DRAFT_2071285 [Mycena sp. CBHHK59/15]
MSKVGADIHASHIAGAGLYDQRGKRKNHDDGRVTELIAVPRYTDALESGEEDSDDDTPNARPRSVLVNSARAWRKVHRKLMVAARDVADDDAMLTNLVASMGAASAKWFPQPLSKLFGGQIKCPFERPARRRFTSEELLMELLAVEHSDEEPDDGEKEGSGDEYEDL